MADRNLRIRMLLEAGNKVSKPLRDIAAGSDKASKALKATRDRLKEIEKAQAEVATFRKLKDQLREVRPELEAARAKAQALGRQLAETDKPTRALTRDFKMAKAEAERLEQRFNSATSQINRMRFDAEKAGNSLSRFARREAELRGEADKLTRSIERQEAALKRRNAFKARVGAGREKFDNAVSKASASTATGLGMIGTGAAIAAPLKLATQDAMDFQSVMADVKKVVNFDPGAAGDRQFKQLGDDILRMSEVIPVSAEGLGQIVAAAGRSGIARKDLAGFAEDAAKMSVAFDMSADDAGTMMATWRTAFNTDRAGVTRLGDQVNALTNAYGGNVVAVNEMVTRIGPLGHVAGTAAGQIAAMAQMMAKMGLESDVGATGIKQVLLTLTRGAATVPKAKKAWAELGLDAIAVSQRMQKDAGGTILDVFGRIAKLSADKRPSILTQLFGRESIAAIAPLLTNLQQLKTNFDMVGNASQYAGSMQREYTSRLGTTANDVQLAQNNFKELGIVVGTQLLPTVTDLARGLSHNLQALTAFARAHPLAIQLAAKFAAVLAALMVAGGAFMFLRAGLLGFIAPFKFAFGLIATEGAEGGLALTKFGQLGWRAIQFLPVMARGVWTFATAIGEAGLALLANPITWIVLAIVAAVGLLALAGYEIYKHWSGISAFFARMFENVKQAFSAFLGWLRGSTLGQLFNIGEMLLQGLINGITGKLGALKSTIVSAASSAANWFKEKMGIHSPSRLFHGFGGYMMQGLANGIHRGAGEPVARLDRLSRRIGAAMAIGAAIPSVAGAAPSTVPLRGSATAQMRAGDHYEIHVHPAKGMDEAALARLVAKELAKLKAQTAAAKHSSFADTPDWDA